MHSYKVDKFSWKSVNLNTSSAYHDGLKDMIDKVDKSKTTFSKFILIWNFWSFGFSRFLYISPVLSRLPMIVWRSSLYRSRSPKPQSFLWWRSDLHTHGMIQPRPICPTQPRPMKSRLHFFSYNSRMLCCYEDLFRMESPRSRWLRPVVLNHTLKIFKHLYILI